MRPILLASSFLGQALTFSHAPGSYSADGRPATFRIYASAPVVWNWSSTGNLPTSNVTNGGTASSIAFTLSNSGTTDKEAIITVQVGGDTWLIDLTATGSGTA